MRILTLCTAVLILAAPGFSQNRYALFLADEPVAKHVASRTDLHSTEAESYRQRLQTAQAGVRGELAKRNIVITGAVNTLLNAVFVSAPDSRVAEMKSIPGVVEVVRLHHRTALLNRATTLMDAPQAWSLTAGGQSNAGAGIKIGILDSGIDQTHPALQDSSLTVPAGFPKCDIPSNCANFTNSKVIVARSYVKQLGAGSNPANPAADSRPDDFSPRDHIGHGTATASVAAANTATGSVTIMGMAPKAYLGNYKILGSPTVNDGTYDDIMISALDDAINDGMDIVSMSVAGPAFSGPLDSGAACDPVNAAGVPCDPAAQAFETAAQKGLTIIIAAGNAGSNSALGYYPLYNTINSPSDAPSVITPGASTNSHTFSELVEVTGTGAPSNLNAIAALPSDSLASGGALTATLVDVTQLGDNGLACSALPARSLTGEIALIERGTCTFAVKMTNAVAAGAAGVIFYNSSGGTFSVGGLGAQGFTQTAAGISNADGTNLKTFIDAHSGYLATIDPNAVEVGGTTPNQVASFSSFGPSLGLNAIKPDLVATGVNVYMPTQNYDPLGEMFSSNRFIMASGTSFATPMTAGAAALVLQNHPEYKGANRALQVKSALVNTATLSAIPGDDQGATVNILQTGAGLLTTDLAIKSNLTVTPAAVSFGSLTSGTLTTPQKFTVTNNSSSPVSLTLTIAQSSTSTGTVPALSPSTLALAAGASGTVSLALSGTLPSGGLYSGTVTIQGGAVPLHVPYMYLVGQGLACDATCQNLQILSGDYDDGTVNQEIPDGQVAFQITDTNGVPIAGVPVTFAPEPGSGITLSQVSSVTDNFGIAYATVTMGSVVNETTGFSVYACANTTSACTANFVNNINNIGYAFTEYARVPPAITAAGVVNNAGYQQPIAPGSYISIFGTGLFDNTFIPTGASSDIANSLPLPLAIDYTTVSFDVPGANPPVSVPGRMYFVSNGQVNVQVPWELQGYSSAQMKVSIDFSYGNVVTVPISNYSPAFFPYGSFAAGTNPNGTVISASNPAVRGTIITLYANGLGPVTNQPPSGAATPVPVLATQLSNTTAPCQVTIGGQSVTPTFCGLSPGSVGLYQINVAVPTGISAGNQALGLSVGGATAPPSSLPIQ